MRLVGYHIRRDHWRRGCAREAAAAIRDWAFENTDHDALCACMKYDDIASMATARAIGMRTVWEYPDPVNGISCVYRIAREETV